MFALLVAAYFAPQGEGAAPPTPYDRVVELEITGGELELIEGQGPTVVAEYEALFEGTLHVWAESEHDLFLQVDDADEALRLAADDNSGGGTTPYLWLEVQHGDRLAALVAGRAGVTGALELHFAAAPETEVTRAAAAKGRSALQRAAQLVAGGDRAGAAELISESVAELVATSGAGSSEAVAQVLFEIGSLAYNELANYEDSGLAWGVARSHRERTLPPDHFELLRAYEDLAISMAHMGDLAGARALQVAVLAGYERRLPADHAEVLRARGNLAASMSMMGDLAGARALQEAVLSVYERTLPADHATLLAARGNLSVLMSRMGDLAGARALQEAVLSAAERTLPTDHPDVLVARQHLAASMFGMGDQAGARVLVSAIERTLLADHAAVLVARSHLAGSMLNMGDLAGARALQEAVLSAWERTLPENHPNLLATRQALANSMAAMGDLAGARALYEAVLASRERTLPEDHLDVLVIRGDLAQSMYEMGDVAGACALLPPLVAGTTSHVLAALALAPRQALGAVAAVSGLLFEVLFLSELGETDQKARAFELTETMRMVGGEAARSLTRFDKDPELAPILSEAASVRRALNDLVAGAGRNEATTDDLAAELTRLSLERDRLEREASRRLAERGVLTRPVDADSLMAALGEAHVAVGYRRIAKWTVNESSGRIEVGADHVLAHVLTADGTLTRVDLGPAAELEELVSAWRAALGAPLLRGVARDEGADDREVLAGRELRARVLDPVLALAGEGAQRLFVCADDLLFLVPLDALPLGDGDVEAEGEDVGRIGDRLQLVGEVSFARLSASTGAVATESVDAEPSLLAFGGVDYDAEGSVPRGLMASAPPIDPVDATVVPPSASESIEETGRSKSGSGGTRSALPERFEKLLQSRYEAEATAGLFEDAFEVRPTLLTREQTTKAALFAAAPGKRYVHLATHGWFAPQSIKSIADTRPGAAMRMGIEERVTGLAPMTLCGLALAGANRGMDSLGRVPGILTAEELGSLDLSQCELAVLSACETNVGIRRAGQGIQSLQAALYAAGARTSITSLWKVDDAATRRLFEVFYTNLWVEKTGTAEALWAAKRTLRQEGHPVRHWAAWVLTGDPD